MELKIIKSNFNLDDNIHNTLFNLQLSKKNIDDKM